MFLLDTNVVSELRKVETGKADAMVSAWARAAEGDDWFLSSITVMELEMGILLLERRDWQQASILRGWLDSQVLPAFGDRVLPVDIDVARRCARLHVPDPRSYRDSLIAATALVHNLTVVTRNLVDFEPMGVTLVNPWNG